MAGAGHLMKDHSGRPAAAPLRDLGQPGARGTAVRGPAGCTHGTQPPPGPPRTDNGAVPDPGAAPAVEDAAEASRAHSPEAPAPRGAARARGLRTARRARPFISRFVCPRRPSRRPSPAARDDAGRCAPPRAPRGSGAGPGAGLARASAIREHLPRLGLGPEDRGVGLSPLGKAHGAEPRRRRRRSPPSPPPPGGRVRRRSLPHWALVPASSVQPRKRGPAHLPPAGFRPQTTQAQSTRRLVRLAARLRTFGHRGFFSWLGR